jgi:Domain of unknown function (DUF6391)
MKPVFLEKTGFMCFPFVIFPFLWYNLDQASSKNLVVATGGLSQGTIANAVCTPLLEAVPTLDSAMLFSSSLVTTIRRNHALEHATIHVLTRAHPDLSLVGRSDWRGYSLYGEVETTEIHRAAHEALARLRAGERNLALHPRCGTVLATTGVLSGLAVFLALGFSNPRGRLRWATLPEAILAATTAALLAHPLGLLVERHITTSGDIGDLSIVRVYRQPGRSVPAHRVETSGGLLRKSPVVARGVSQGG